MTKQTSVRLDQDVEKFIESLTTTEFTKTDIINGIMRQAKENMEKGIKSTTEIRIPFSKDMDIKVTELEKVLETINKIMRSYFCWEAQSSKNYSNGSSLPSSMIEFPCIRNIEHDCKEGKDPHDICPLEQHREWRELLKRHLGNTT